MRKLLLLTALLAVPALSCPCPSTAPCPYDGAEANLYNSSPNCTYMHTAENYQVHKFTLACPK